MHHRSLLLPVLVALAGANLAGTCIENVINPDPDPDNPTMLLEVEPEIVHFGGVEAEDVVVREVTLRNVGQANLQIQSVETYGAGFALTEHFETTLLEPEQELVVQVQFSPTAVENVGELLVDVPGIEEDQVAVMLAGNGMFPQLKIIPAEYEFGAIPLCVRREVELTLLNLGDADLVVSGMAHTGSDMGLVELPELPFTLAPSESTSVSVDFQPYDVDAYSGTLWVESNDLSGTDEAVQTGLGELPAVDEYVDEFRQPDGPWDEADILFYVDQSASMDGDWSRLREGFATLATLLDMEDVDWQVIVVTDDDGCANGGLIRSGDPYAGADFADAIRGPSGLLAESGLSLAYNALLATGPDQCNEGFLREGAKPMLVMISDEAEQSEAPWSSVLASIQGVAPDAVVVSIVGPFPSGCENAEVGTGYLEAADVTGGLSFSLCETDWSAYFARASELVDQPTDTFELSYVPDPDTIVVEVDGVGVSSGWTYDVDENAVVFDTMPASGSDVRVAYRLAEECL